ncbi:MAG: hypothetical protein HYX65_09145 [Gemmatimonadetes bacterium]|nr:hypothetical protein [Gemmatimonadota bacterium]
MASAPGDRSRAAIDRLRCTVELVGRRASHPLDGTRRHPAWYRDSAPEWPAVKSRIEGLPA